MKTQSYNKELLISTAQFMDIFSDIVIDKGDKSFNVSTIFGQRSRIFKDLQNPDKGNIITPLIVVTRTGLSRDTERVNDVNDHLKDVTSSYNYDNWIPNPINIEFQMSIISKNQSDVERIIGNFIPFFNPDVYVRTKHPKIPSKHMNLQIHWTGDIDEEWPEELDPSDYDFKIATTNFTMKTSIFAGTNDDVNSGSDDSGIIHDIRFALTDTLSGETGYPDTNVGGWFDVPTTYAFDDYYNDVSDGSIVVDYDNMIVSVNPVIEYVSPKQINLNESTTLNVYGYNLIESHQLSTYVTATSGVFDDEQPIMLNGEETGHTGIQVDVNYLSDNSMVINCPPPQSDGFIAVIITGGDIIEKWTDHEHGYGIKCGIGFESPHIPTPPPSIDIDWVDPIEPQLLIPYTLTIFGNGLSKTSHVYVSGTDDVLENEQQIPNSPYTGIEVDFTINSDNELITDGVTFLNNGCATIVLIDTDGNIVKWTDEELGFGIQAGHGLIGPIEDIPDYEEGRSFGSTRHGLLTNSTFINITTLPKPDFISQCVEMGLDCNAVFTYAGITTVPPEYINTFSTRMDLYTNTEIFEMTILGTKNIIVPSIKSDFDCTAVHIDMITGEIIEV